MAAPAKAPETMVFNGFPAKEVLFAATKFLKASAGSCSTRFSSKKRLSKLNRFPVWNGSATEAIRLPRKSRVLNDGTEATAKNGTPPNKLSDSNNDDSKGTWKYIIILN